jgi:hypothetical protein
MNKETWERCKKAYLITINGCGRDCLECSYSSCLCDNKKIKADAKRWIRQKTYERQFYKANRDKRLQAAKDWYNLHRKKTKDLLSYRKLNEDILSILPESFTYNDAAKAWLVDYSCAVERVKNFIKRGLLKKKRQAVKNRLFVNVVVVTKIKQEAL